MDWGYAIFLVVAFVAVVLLLEGAYLLWNDFRGPEARQLDRRIRALAVAGSSKAESQLLKDLPGENASAVERLLMRIPRVASLDKTLRRAGLTISSGRFVLMAALFATAAGLGALVFRLPAMLALLLALGAFGLAFTWLFRRVRERLASIEKQLPDAVELIARALRAGHSLPPAIQMVADESAEPIASEFQIVSEEVTFGVSLDDAMMNLAQRVPLDDLRYFVIAVILQRETGGNLAEILDNIGRLIRERFKLLGSVRVLSAEGRLSAWILSALPFVTAFMIQLVSPGFMNILWTDPGGPRLVIAALVAMVVGVFWIWRLVKIRV